MKKKIKNIQLLFMIIFMIGLISSFVTENFNWMLLSIAGLSGTIICAILSLTVK